MELHERIAAVRRAAGLTQEQLGEQLGVTRQAVSKWESGQTVPDAHTVARLCQVLHVSADYVLLGIDPETQQSVPNASANRISDATPCPCCGRPVSGSLCPVCGYSHPRARAMPSLTAQTIPSTKISISRRWKPTAGWIRNTHPPLSHKARNMALCFCCAAAFPTVLHNTLPPIFCPHLFNSASCWTKENLLMKRCLPNLRPWSCPLLPAALPTDWAFGVWSAL